MRGIFIGAVALSMGLFTLEAAAAEDDLSGSALRWLDEHAEELVATADALWETPELAHREHETTRRLVAELRAAGFRVEVAQAVSRRHSGRATAPVVPSSASSPFSMPCPGSRSEPWSRGALRSSPALRDTAAAII